MGLSRLDLSANVADRLNELAAIVKTRSRAGLNDASQILETVCARFFTALHGWELKNLNIEQSNFPAADLGDVERRIAVQITNQEKGSKITNTAKMAQEHQLDKTFDRLIVFFLLARKPSLPSDFAQPINGPIIETWDIADVLKQVKEIESLSVLTRAARVLDEELGKISHALDATNEHHVRPFAKTSTGKFGADFEGLRKQTVAKRLLQQRLCLEFTCSDVYPNLQRIRQFEKNFIFTTWNDTSVRENVAFDAEKVDVVLPPGIDSAIAAAETIFGSSTERIEVLRLVLVSGIVDIVNHCKARVGRCLPNVAITMFAGGLFSMIVAELRAQAGAKALRHCKVSTVALCNPFYWPEVETFYGEKLVSIDVYDPKSEDYVRVHIPADGEMGDFFSVSGRRDRFSAWDDPGWCSRYLVPQMTIRKVLSGGPMIEDFAGFLIGPA
jgi:hypothetical protein